MKGGEVLCLCARSQNSEPNRIQVNKHVKKNWKSSFSLHRRCAVSMMEFPANVR